MDKRPYIQKILASWAFVAYVFLSIFGLITVQHHMHHASSMQDCPYMAGQQAICVSIFDHIHAWQAFSMVIFPFVYIILYYVITWSDTKRTINISPPLLYLKYFFKKIKISLYQELFSCGILHTQVH